MAGTLVKGIGFERIDQHVGAKDVDAHRCEVRIGLLGLLGKLDDAPIVLICSDDTEAARLFPGHGHNGDREVGIVLDVRLQHLAVIHAIEMVTG